MNNIQSFPDPTNVFDHIDIAMVRDPKHYSYRSYTGDPLTGDPLTVRPRSFLLGRKGLEKIQLGAGFKHIDGWRNLEYPDWDADLPIPAAGYSARDYSESKLPYLSQSSNSVHEIASYHTLDHLSPAQVIQTLREVERVLVPGGTFTNILPHADSQLAKECIHHQSRFMIDTWRNIFSERQYEHDGEWQLEVGLNFTFSIAERNTVLVTQLLKKG